MPPVILLAHLDVVPVEPGTGSAWTHPPFAGVVADGSVWGRGAIDDKAGVLGLLEAAEALLAGGFQPTRTVLLAFGHNEEGGGDPSGAAAIASLLASRGVHDAWLLDEGGMIYRHTPGVSQPVAFIGVTEKTAIDVELVAHAAGGHASMPPGDTAVGILAGALDRVARHPMPARLQGPTLAMFEMLAPHMPLLMRGAFANLWLTRPIVLRRLASQPETNATIRTTIAPTMLSASPKDNVLAAEARAVLNVRLLPPDTAAAVEAHLHGVIGDDRVTVDARGGGAPPNAVVSPTRTPVFTTLAGIVRGVYPEVLVAPFVTIGATDAREYRGVAPAAYRFLPIDQDGAVEQIHGTNEHVGIDAYARAIRVYATVIERIAGADPVRTESR